MDVVSNRPSEGNHLDVANSALLQPVHAGVLDTAS